MQTFKIKVTFVTGAFFYYEEDAKDIQTVTRLLDKIMDSRCKVMIIGTKEKSTVVNKANVLTFEVEPLPSKE